MPLTQCPDCGKDVSTVAAACPHCGRPMADTAALPMAETESKGHGDKAPKKHIGCIPSLVIIFLVVWAIGKLNGGAKPTAETTGSSAAVAGRADSKNQISLDLVKVDYEWHKIGDSIMEADFTIKNTASSGVKDIEITCSHYANSGTKIDSNKRTIYEVIGSGKTIKVPKFNMGFVHSQAQSTSCVVTDVVVIQ